LIFLLDDFFSVGSVEENCLNFPLVLLFRFSTFFDSFEAHIKCIFSFFPLEKNDVESQTFFLVFHKTTKKYNSSQHRNKIKCSRWFQFLDSFGQMTENFINFLPSRPIRKLSSKASDKSHHERFMGDELELEKLKQISNWMKMHKTFIRLFFIIKSLGNLSENPFHKATLNSFFLSRFC
jgi:hypothetical protein